MKKPIKILVYVILSILFLMVVLVIAASLSQKRIVDIALNKINESSNVPIEIEKLSFTLIKRFPRATIELSGVKIGALDSIGANKTNQPIADILNIESVFVSVKTLPLFIGNFDIIRVEINDAILNYKVDSLGNSNVESFLNANANDSSVVDTSGSLPTLNLRKVKLKNIAILYEDDKLRASAHLFLPDIDFTGKFANENYNGNIEGGLQLSKCSYGETNLNKMEETTFDFKLDYKSDTLQIEKFEANTDGANLELTGKIVFTKNLFADLKLESKELDLEKLLKYAPDSLISEYVTKEINGIFRLSSTLKVNASDPKLPSFDIVLDLNDANTKMKEPSMIENLSFEGVISNSKQLNNKTISSIIKKIQLKNNSGTEETSIDFKLDYISDTLQIKKVAVNADGTNLEVAGKVAFENDLYTDLNLESNGLEIGKLLKYVPDSLINKYGVENINGIMRFKGTVIGNVSDTISPAIDLSLNLENGYAKIKEYPTVKKLSFEGNISNGFQQNNTTTSIIIKNFQAETDSSKIDLSLLISNIDKPNYTLNSKLSINIEEFKDLIPDSLIQNISGKIVADFQTKGELPDSIDDSFIDLVVNNTSANLEFLKVYMERDSFAINDFSGSIIYLPGQLSMNNLKGFVPGYALNIINSSFNAEFTGPVMQPQNLEIRFHNFNIESPQGRFWGSAKVENLEHPDFVVDASANLNLKLLKPFLPDTLVKSISGNLAAKINSHGKLNLDSIAEQATDIVFKQSKFTFDAKNVSLTMADTLQELTNFNGSVRMGNDTIFISKMSGIAAGMDFAVDSTTLVNICDAVVKNQRETVFMYGNIKLGAVDYSILAPFIPAEPSENTTDINGKTEPKANDSEPRNFWFEFKGKIAAKSVKYEKILAENISAKFNLSDSVYIIDQLKVNAFDGTSNSSIRFSIVGNGKQIINVKNQVTKMDINKFMYAFDNFGYDSLISYKNIKGLVSADLSSRFVFNADTLVTEDMRVKGDLTLENGRIINYQPAMDVASFTGIKELDNIDLKTLKSNLFIFKNQMFVPATNVVSSSMDFSVFGMQSFGDNYEYHLQLHLGDVLKGKSKRLIERQSSSGDEISTEDMDRSTIKIIYANIDGKAKAGFDNKKAQKAMELKIKVQQTMLDLIFYPKLVSFDTGVK